MTYLDSAKIRDGLDPAATVALLIGAGVGLLCANLDADAIEEDGWPRLARAIRLGRAIGGLALKVREIKGGKSLPPSDPAPPTPKSGGAS